MNRLQYCMKGLVRHGKWNASNLLLKNYMVEMCEHFHHIIFKQQAGRLGSANSWNRWVFIGAFFLLFASITLDFSQSPFNWQFTCQPNLMLYIKCQYNPECHSNPTSLSQMFLEEFLFSLTNIFVSKLYHP